MTTKQIIEKMENVMLDLIVECDLNIGQPRRPMIRKTLRTLLESFGEEIIALFALPKIDDKELEQALKDMPGVEQIIRLKVKEIITNLK